MAIAFFYAVGTGIGGIVGPIYFGKLIEQGRDGIVTGYYVGAGADDRRRPGRALPRRRRRAALARGHRHSADRRGGRARASDRSATARTAATTSGRRDHLDRRHRAAACRALPLTEGRLTAYAGAGSRHRAPAPADRQPDDAEVAPCPGADPRRRRDAAHRVDGVGQREHDETACSTSSISSRGTSRPQSRNCGSTNAGMNCTAWNSVAANALTNRPSAMPSSASSDRDDARSSQAGPATSRPYTVSESVADHARPARRRPRRRPARSRAAGRACRSAS